jgi:Ras-related C3 botulinum toxin substrate 1
MIRHEDSRVLVKNNSQPYQIRHHCPNVPYLFIGCKSDLRNGPATFSNGQIVDLGPDPVTTEQGEARAKELGAYKYLEW